MSKSAQIFFLYAMVEFAGSPWGAGWMFLWSKSLLWSMPQWVVKRLHTVFSCFIAFSSLLLLVLDESLNFVLVLHKSLNFFLYWTVVSMTQVQILVGIHLIWMWLDYLYSDATANRCGVWVEILSGFTVCKRCVPIWKSYRIRDYGNGLFVIVYNHDAN